MFRRRRKYRSKSVLYGPPKKKRLDEMFKKKRKLSGVSLGLKSVQMSRRSPAKTFCFVESEPPEDLQGLGKIILLPDETIEYKHDDHPYQKYIFSYDRVLHDGMDVEDVFNQISKSVIEDIEMGRSSVLFYVAPSRFVEEQNVLTGHPSLDEEEHQNGVLSWIVSDLLENKKSLLDLSDISLRVSIANCGVDQNVMENCEHYNVSTRIDQDLESIRDILVYSEARIKAFIKMSKTRKPYSYSDDEDDEDDSDDESEKTEPSVIYEIPLRTISGIETNLIMVQVHDRHFRSILPIVRRGVNLSNYNETRPETNRVNQAIQAAVLRRIPHSNRSYGITVLGHGFQDSSRACKNALEVVHKCHLFKKRRMEMSVHIDTNTGVDQLEKAMKLAKMKELSNGIRKELISLITNFRQKQVVEVEDEGEEEDIGTHKRHLNQLVTDTIPEMYRIIDSIRSHLEHSQEELEEKTEECEELKHRIEELGEKDGPEGWISPDQLKLFINELDKKTQEEREEYERSNEQWRKKCGFLKEQVQLLQEEEVDEEGLKMRLLNLRQTNISLQEENEKKMKKIELLEEEMEAVEDEKVLLEERLDKSEESKSKMGEQIDSLMEVIGVLKSRKPSSEEEVVDEQWRKMYEDKVRLQQDLYNARLELHDLKLKMKKLMNNNNNKEEEIKKDQAATESSSSGESFVDDPEIQGALAELENLKNTMPLTPTSPTSSGRKMKKPRSRKSSRPVLSFYEDRIKRFEEEKEVREAELEDLKNISMQYEDLKRKHRSLQMDFKGTEEAIKVSKEAEEMLMKRVEKARHRNKQLKMQEKEKIEKMEGMVKLIEGEKHKLAERIVKLTAKTRLDEKIEEITKEEFWTYNPTKFASLNIGKLEFHHNIFEFPKFICRFMKEVSKYQNEESYEEMRRTCIQFENVVVCLSEDRRLRKFVEKTKEKYLFNLRMEMTKKESRVSNELKEIVKNMILDVCRFFFPHEYIKDGSNEARTTPDLETIRKFITESQERRGGNQLFLGDLYQKFGVCRHHSTLLKLVCDSLGILCKLECIEEFHAWNLIQLKEQFYFVDITNFQNRLFGLSEYYEMLESNLDNLEVNKVQERLIRKLVIRKQVERLQISRLKDYIQNPSHFMEEVFLFPVQKGGFGDVMLMKIRRDVMMFPSIERLFEDGEVIAVKKIMVRDEGEEGSSSSDLTLSSGKDGIPRRYAIREASHMKILDHCSIIRVIGYWESRDKNNVPHVYIAMNGMDQDGRGFVHTLKNKSTEEMSKIQKLTEVVYFLIETARGLRYLSTLKIVHLDLKLENVMIRWDSEKNQILDVRIIDFGGAKNNDIQTSNFMTTEGYDAPEIIDIKIMKNVKENIQKIRSEMNNVRMNRRTIQNLVNSTSAKFMELSQTIHVKELEEEFKFLCKVCEEMKFRFSSEVKEELQKKILSRKYVEEVSPSLSSSSSVVSKARFFDCRADIYSFGVMMDEFLGEGFLPQELKYLKQKCLEFDRRDRPSIDEVIYVLKQHLSFFNEKMKEGKFI